MDTSKFIEGFRKAMVDVLVPEIRQLREEMNDSFEKMDARFEKMDARFEKMDARFEKMDERFEKMDERFTTMDMRFEKMLEIVTDTRLDIKDLKSRDKVNDWMLTRVVRLEDEVDKIKHRLTAH